MTGIARTPVARHGLTACLAVAVCVILGAPAGAGASRPLRTAIASSAGGSFGADTALAYSRIRDAGATAIRLGLSWQQVAPEGAAKPAGFVGTDPADPAYHWEAFDEFVRLAVAHDLEPIVTIADAPQWAQGEQLAGPRGATVSPDPVEFGRFAEAAAKHYGGQLPGVPRVRIWEAWNEPNLSSFLSPQAVDGKLASPELYRRMVNSFAAGVHAAHADNVVVAGALFPFELDLPNVRAVGPLQFMREMFCLSRRLKPIAGCGEPVHLDAWSTHPYTSGGPTHKAAGTESVSLGDLPRMRHLLRAAVSSGRIASASRVRFWVTEFAWDSKPADPHGVPLQLHGRWVAQAMYQMWRSGVTLVTWYLLRDDAKGDLPDPQVAQSGLYFRCAAGMRCDRPKPALTAFRFPFVAFRAGRRARVWGRTQSSRRGRVVVEQSIGRRWRRVATLRADRYGIFQGHVRRRGRGELRARAAGLTSLPFSLRPARDLPVNPFG